MDYLFGSNVEALEQAEREEKEMREKLDALKSHHESSERLKQFQRRNASRSLKDQK